jgi:hypothetical protein
MANRELKLYWRTPEDIISMTHSGQIASPRVPVGIASLPSISSRSQLVLVANLRDSTGAYVGTMTELEVFTDADEFEIYMTAVLPNRGAVASYQLKSWEGVMRPFIELGIDGREWVGSRTVLQTTGPAPASKGVVIASHGEFEGLAGLHQQTVTYTRISADGATAEACEHFTFS